MDKPRGSEHDGQLATATLSGVFIQPVATVIAAAFLQRVTDFPAVPLSRALGAFDDAPTLIGVLGLAAPTPMTTTVLVAVTPDRRRLKVGTDLFHALGDLPAGDVHDRLCFHHHIDSEPAAGFLRSLGLRILHQTPDATVVVYPPPPPTPAEQEG